VNFFTHSISYLKISSLYYITRELDINSQLGFSMNKNDILKNEIDDLKAKITKLANIVTDTNSRLVFYMNKNEKLKKEIEDLKAKNTNITNIAKEFIKRDGARFAEKTSNLIMEMKMNRLKRDRVGSTSEFGPEFGPEFEPEFSDKFKTDYTHHSLENCYHNPGGATVYTKANAMNRMVFNPLLGIYEPGDEK